MGKNIEILLYVMNLKNEEELDKIIEKNKISSRILAVNQVDSDDKMFSIENKNKRLYSYNEKGASLSRNRLLENANGDICVFADDDTKYVENYEKIIQEEFKNKPEVDVLIFYIENQNTNREKIKRIGNKKLGFLDIMRVRSSEIAIKKDALIKIRKNNIKFNNNFGPEGIFLKGEETIFVSELLKKGFKIYSVNQKIGTVNDTESTWFTGYNEKYLYDQGAIFYKLSPKMYKLLILQYVIRKYFQYRRNVKFWNAYKQMVWGANDCKNLKDNFN